jgi:hypothetical protein
MFKPIQAAMHRAVSSLALLAMDPSYVFDKPGPKQHPNRGLVIVLQANTMAWNIAHIASDEALKRAVCSEVRSESDPFARGASVSSMTSAGIAISANKSELPLLDKCMRETNRLYGILLLAREVRRCLVFLSEGAFEIAFCPSDCKL